MNHAGLDETDRKILELLKENARLTFSEIGEKTGITRVSVKNRMAAMEKCGVIRGYKAIVDPTMVPEGVKFFLDVEAVPEFYEEVLEALCLSPLIRKVYAVSGECRIHADGFSPNQSQLNLFANGLYRKTKGVRRISWQQVIAAYKDEDGGVDYVRCKEPEHMEK